MHPIVKLAAGMDTNAGLSRLKTQGQDFNRAYTEFVFFRDFALSNPLTAQRWAALNKLALSTRKVVSGVNSHIDAANNITQMVFGDGLLSLLPEASNLYLMSGNAALAYVIQEMRVFNAGMTRLVQERAAQDAETNPE